MLSTMWFLIKALAGGIAIVFLAGVLLLLLKGLLDVIFKN